MFWRSLHHPQESYYYFPKPFAYCEIFTVVELKNMKYIIYAVWSKSSRPDIQKPRQMENGVRDI